MPTPGAEGRSVLVAQFGATDNDLDYAVKLSDNSTGNVQGQAISPVDGSMYITASSETPPDILVIRIADLLFTDDFESGDTSRWAASVSD